MSSKRAPSPYFLVAIASLWSGCATLGIDNDHNKIKISETSEESFVTVAHEAQRGQTPYTGFGPNQSSEWLACRTKAAARGTIIIAHSDRAGYDPDKFCSGWLGQSFLAQNFNVLMINRPGYGKSTGTPDFCGAQSIAAMEAAAKDATQKGTLTPPVGAWGYDTGAACAALVARKLASLNFLILGGGVYDYEDTLAKTADGYLKKDIETIKSTGGDKAIEDRSIAYDIEGLPKVVVIYHGKQDTAVPPGQAKSFSDSLVSSGNYQVTFQVIDGVAHEIPWPHHRKILEVLAVSVQGKASTK